MVTLFLTPDTPQLTTYHYTYQGSTGEAGAAVAVLVPLDVNASGDKVVPQYIRQDPNLSIEVVIRPLSVDIIGATAAVLVFNPATQAYTGFTFALNNSLNAAATFNMSVEIRHSYTR